MSMKGVRFIARRPGIQPVLIARIQRWRSRFDLVGLSLSELGQYFTLGLGTVVYDTPVLLHHGHFQTPAPVTGFVTDW